MEDQQITVGLVLFIFAVIAAASGAWWRIEGKVKEAKMAAYQKTDEAKNKAELAISRAELSAQQLSDYKTHVAETYISKAGHRESNEQIMGALSGVKSAIDGTNQRIDRLFDERPTRGGGQS